MSNKLAVIKEQLDGAASVKDMVHLPFVQERFVMNYEKTTGKKDGDQRFQQETFNFLEIANTNPAIMKCDRFSIFAAIVKSGTTGLSFRDGHLYPIPYGKTLKTTIGAHGKRELLMRMATIKFVSEAQLVVKGEAFVYDKMNSKVISHSGSLEKTPALTMENILGAYFRIEFMDGKIIDILMTQEDLKGAMKAAKTQSIWIAWPGEMCKKSVYNRGFKLYHRYSEGEFSAHPEFDAPDGETAPPFVDAKEVDSTEKPKTEGVDKKEEPQNTEPESSNEIISEAEIVEEETPKEEGGETNDDPITAF